MKRRLWVDDLRDPPDDSWMVVRTSRDAVAALVDKAFDDVRHFDVISLDHDLGGDDTTREMMLFMCEFGFWPREILVHSANPVGREWLEGMIARYRPS